MSQAIVFSQTQRMRRLLRPINILKLLVPLDASSVRFFFNSGGVIFHLLCVYDYNNLIIKFVLGEILYLCVFHTNGNRKC